jgi:hypothetical protein
MVGPDGVNPQVGGPASAETQYQKTQEKQQDTVRKDVVNSNLQDVQQNDIQKTALQGVKDKAAAQQALNNQAAVADAPKFAAPVTVAVPQQVALPQGAGQLDAKTLDAFKPTIRDSLNQLQSLANLFANSGNSSLQQLGAQISNQLQQLAQADPKFPSDTLDQINKMVDKMTQNSKDLPDDLRNKYFAGAQAAMQKIIDKGNELNAPAQSEAADQTEVGVDSTDTAPLFNTLNDLLQKITSGKELSPDELSQFTTVLNQLKAQRDMSEGSPLADKIDKMFEMLDTNFKDENGHNILGEMIARQQAFKATQAYNEETTPNDATSDGLGDAISAAGGHYLEENAGDVPFLQDVGNQIKEIGESIKNGHDASGTTYTQERTWDHTTGRHHDEERHNNQYYDGIKDTTELMRFNHENKTHNNYSVVNENFLKNSAADIAARIAKLPTDQLQGASAASSEAAQGVTSAADNRDRDGARVGDNLDALTAIINGARANLNNISAQGGDAPVNPNIYGAVMDGIGQEAEDLSSMAQYLINWGPEQGAKEGRSFNPVSSEDVGKLQDIQNQLAQIQAQAPNLTPDQVELLPKFLEEITAVGEKIDPGKASGNFWNLSANLYKRIGDTVSQYATEASSRLETAQKLFSSSSEIQQILSGFPDLLDSVSQNPTPENTGQLADNLIKMLQIRSDQNTPDSVKESIVTLLNQFVSPGGQFGNLYDVLSEGLVANALKNAEGGTAEDVIAAAQQDLTTMASALQNSNDPLSAGLGPSLQKAIDDLDQNGTSYISVSGRAPELTPTFYDTFTKLDPQTQIQNLNVDQIKFATGGIKNVIDSYLDEVNNSVDDLTAQSSTLSDLSEQMGINYDVCKGKARENMSLPDYFYNMVLDPVDGFMARQNAKLSKQGQELSFNNQGARMTNSVLGDMTSFSQAASNYDFTSSLQHAPNEANNVFNGRFEDVKGQLDREKEQIKTDLVNTDNALAKVSEARANISSQVQAGKLTQDQAKELNTKLDNYEANLTNIKGQLSNLKDTLDGLQINSKGDDQFTIDGPGGWENTLKRQEDVVINGDSSNPNAMGGLQHFQTAVTNDQQNYSNQGQQSQMELQLLMTQIQQCWTIVSTAMSMLHQMRMTILQNLNK